MVINKKPTVYDVDLYGGAAVVTVCLLVWLAVVRPLQQKTIEKRDELAQTTRLQTTALTELSAAEDDLQRQNMLAGRLRRSPNVLAGNRGLDSVIGRLDVLADECLVSLDQIRADESSMSEHTFMTPLHLTIEGTFGRTMHWLAQVTDSMPYLRINTMKLANSYQSQGICRVTAELHVFASR